MKLNTENKERRFSKCLQTKREKKEAIGMAESKKIKMSKKQAPATAVALPPVPPPPPPVPPLVPTEVPPTPPILPPVRTEMPPPLSLPSGKQKSAVKYEVTPRRPFEPLEERLNRQVSSKFFFFNIFINLIIRKNFGFTKLTAFADDKLIMVGMIIFSMQVQRNEENACDQHFLFFLLYFQVFFPRALFAWLSGEHVRLITLWLRVVCLVEVNFLSGLFSPLTSTEAEVSGLKNSD